MPKVNDRDNTSQRKKRKGKRVNSNTTSKDDGLQQSILALRFTEKIIIYL
jgi:hypothetical protein